MQLNLKLNFFIIYILWAPLNYHLDIIKPILKLKISYLKLGKITFFIKCTIFH